MFETLTKFDEWKLQKIVSLRIYRKKTLNSMGISDLSVESCFVDNTNFLRYWQIIDNNLKSHL